MLHDGSISTSQRIKQPRYANRIDCTALSLFAIAREARRGQLAITSTLDSSLKSLVYDIQKNKGLIHSFHGSEYPSRTHIEDRYSSARYPVQSLRRESTHNPVEG